MHIKHKYSDQQSILLCIATEKGFSVLRSVSKSKYLNFKVTTYKEVKVLESFDEKILSFAKDKSLSAYRWKDINKGGVEWLKKKKIWAIVCVGWKYLIPKEWIEHLDNRVLIAHDSILPKYRGFAPLATAIINGENEVGLTIMLAGTEMDTGNIVYQKRIQVKSNDTIYNLINRLLPLYGEGIVLSLEKMLDGKLNAVEQDHSKATYSIWRDERDLWINWNEPASKIERTIRALGQPYLGAHSKLDNDVVTIQKAEVVPDIQFEIRQPGKVWSLNNEGSPIVVCGSGLLLICDATFKSKSLIPMKILRVRFH
jgi:methionyl-tRNA formyltransferase